MPERWWGPMRRWRPTWTVRPLPSAARSIAWLSAMVGWSASPRTGGPRTPARRWRASACQWSGVATITISRAVLGQHFPVVLEESGVVPAQATRLVGGRPECLLVHIAEGPPPCQRLEAIASRRMLAPHQPHPTRATRWCWGACPARRGKGSREAPAASLEEPATGGLHGLLCYSFTSRATALPWSAAEDPAVGQDRNRSSSPARAPRCCPVAGIARACLR